MKSFSIILISVLFSFSFLNAQENASKEDVLAMLNGGYNSVESLRYHTQGEMPTQKVKKK